MDFKNIFKIDLLNAGSDLVGVGWDLRFCIFTTQNCCDAKIADLWDASK